MLLIFLIFLTNFHSRVKKNSCIVCRNAVFFYLLSFACVRINFHLIFLSPIPFRFLFPEATTTLFTLTVCFIKRSELREPTTGNMLLHVSTYWWCYSNVMGFTGNFSLQWWGLGSMNVWCIFWDTVIVFFFCFFLFLFLREVALTLNVRRRRSVEIVTLCRLRLLWQHWKKCSP